MNKRNKLMESYHFMILAITLPSIAVFASTNIQDCAQITKSQTFEFSMCPTIKYGACIAYEDVSIGNLKKGDIVVYIDFESGEKICHRVESIEGESIWTKGDNNRFRDRRIISDTNLLGLVTHVDGRSV